ncbi:MAG: hypothetical protein AAGA60_22795 [Cyanobacteria bacterium P01_E01_bin.42]
MRESQKRLFKNKCTLKAQEWGGNSDSNNSVDKPSEIALLKSWQLFSIFLRGMFSGHRRLEAFY